MPYKNESMLMGGDATADTSTELSFNPPNGPFDADNVVKGTIDRVGDEDWIAIKLTEGNTYTINVGGGDDGDDNTMNDLNDSVLKLMDGKGGLIAENDDVKPAEGMLGSEIEFTPEAGSGTQVYFISVSGYTGNPGAKNTGAYTVSVKEVAHPPAGEGVDIPGTDMDDKLTGTDDSESISGEDGNDSLFGLGGDDSLDGGSGNDLLVGGAGADMLKGGSGTDTISYAGSPMGVSINLRAGTASGGDAEGDTLGEMIENVMGSDQDDMLSGSRGNNMLWGHGGNDELYGDRGMDTLFGGMGDDELDGGDGNDTLEGGYGADELTGGGGDDTASYASSMMGVTVRLHARQAMGGDAEGDTWGDTEIVKYDNPDLDADPEDAVLEETVPDIVHLTGSAMADILAGDSRANTIMGGGGDDKLYGGPGGGDDKLYGGGGNDMLFGGRGADELHGGAGDDMLVGGMQGDMIYGGAGSDVIYAEATGDIINGWLPVHDPNDPDNTAPLDDTSTDAPPNVDESTEAANDPDAIDTVSFERLEEGVGVAGTPWTLGTNATNVENVIGSPENDVIAGDARDNVIEGGDGADNLDGDGTAGNTSQVNGDTVSYANSDRRVTVTIDADGTGTASGGHAQGDTIANFENVTGSAHDDNLTGDETDNVIKGGAGEDRLRGEVGSDTIEGGAGADELYGGTASGATLGVDTDADTLSYASSDAGVTVNLATLLFSGGHAEGDEDRGATEYDHDSDAETDSIDVSTFENITGSDHNDRLTGDHRVNTLTGGKGDDTLRGGAQVDTLIGGPGADALDGGEDAQEKDNMVPDPNNPGSTIAASVDVASYAGAMAGVTVNLATGRGTAGDAMGDTLTNIEHVLGSDHDDTFIAGPGSDSIDGDGNPDMMPAGDTVSYELSDDPVSVDLGAAGGVQSNANLTVDNVDDSYAMDDILLNIENVTGSPGDDTLRGSATSANTLKGGAGDDILNGVGGNNKLMGDAGDDDLDGSTGNDELMGGAGNDTLDGGGGTDMFYGGAGDDVMTGGSGIDTFVFSPEDGDGDDIIEDVITHTSGDKIDLRAFNLDAEDLIPLLSVRGGTVRIDLRSVGGGTIELDGVTDRDSLEDGTAADAADDDMIGTLSEWDDANDNGMVDSGESGIFIL